VRRLADAISIATAIFHLHMALACRACGAVSALGDVTAPALPEAAKGAGTASVGVRYGRAVQEKQAG
jgi:hypothetical protein